MNKRMIADVMYEAHYILVGLIQEQNKQIGNILPGDHISQKVHLSKPMDEILGLVGRYYYMGREDMRKEYTQGQKPIEGKARKGGEND